MAAGLRQAGHHVILACRNAERCANAAAQLDARSLPGSAECRSLNLDDYASIRAFAAQLTEEQTQLAVLCNNAGVMGTPPAADGSCGHLRPNHLGPFLLTRMLLPLLAPHARVVNVASEAHRRGTLSIGGGGGSGSGGSSASSGSAAGSSGASDTLRLEGPPPSNWYSAYARSKLCNVLFTAELSRQLTARGSSITACSVSPGRVSTHIFANVPWPLATPLRWLAAAAFQTPAQGARTVLHAALAPELRGRHELYMHNQAPCAASPAAHDPRLAERLWALSVQEVGMTAAQDAALWPPQ